MKTELTPEDRARIEQEAKNFEGEKDGTYNQNYKAKGFKAGAEYATRYERQQFEQERKNAYDAGLMCQRILDKDQIEKLETEQAEVKNENIKLEEARIKHSDYAAKALLRIEQLEAERSEVIRFLEWNISSIKHSTASREAQIRLEIFQSLLDKLNSLKTKP